MSVQVDPPGLALTLAQASVLVPPRAPSGYPADQHQRAPLRLKMERHLPFLDVPQARKR